MILLWERWRPTRWFVIAAYLVSLSGRLMYETGFITSQNAVLFWFVGFVSLAFVLVMGQCETQRVDFAFPKRLFRFPIGTMGLLAVYMGYGVAAVALHSLIFFGFDEPFFESISNGWMILLILETVLFVLQTFYWLGGSAFFLCLTLSLTAVVTLPFFIDRYYPIILCPAIIFLCGAISFWNVSAYRHGTRISGWQGWQYIGSFFGMMRNKPSKSFASPLHAQIWFESRQAGYIFPLVTLCIICPFLIWLIVSLTMGAPQSMPVSPLVPLSFGATVVAAFIAGGLAVGVYYRDYPPGALNFCLRRPMSTRKLAAARLYAMMRSLLCVLAILLVLTLLVIACDWATGALDEVVLSPVKWALKYSSPLETITMTVLGLYGFALFYWTLLRLGLALVLGIGVLSIITWLIGDVAASWVWNALVVGLPLSVLVAFFVARLRNLITTGILVCSACVFPLAVVSLWAFPWWFTTSGSMGKGLPILNLSQIILIMAGATLPFIPVVATPLLMDKLRHR